MGVTEIKESLKKPLIVTVGDMAVSNDPNIIMSAYGLGSCIGLALYDSALHIGGLLHCMLPDSQINPAKAASRPSMFVDTGIAKMLKTLEQFNASKSRLKAFLAGGANMTNTSDLFRIGECNTNAVKKILNSSGIALCGLHIGGTHNRTLSFSIKTGTVQLQCNNHNQTFSLN